MKRRTSLIDRACAVCGDNDDVLIACNDGRERCPPCCVDAHWCLSCGSKVRGEADMTGLCASCSPVEVTFK